MHAAFMLLLLGATFGGGHDPAAVQAAALRERAALREVMGESHELVLGDLTRAALVKPDAPETWAALAVQLRGVSGRESGAERRALAVLDSLVHSRAGILEAVMVRPATGGSEVLMDFSGPVPVRLQRRTSSGGDALLSLVLPGGVAALPAEQFPAINRGGVRAISVGRTAAGALRVDLDLEHESHASVRRFGHALIVSLSGTPHRFQPWTASLLPTWLPWIPVGAGTAVGSTATTPSDAAPSGLLRLAATGHLAALWTRPTGWISHQAPALVRRVLSARVPHDDVLFGALVALLGLALAATFSGRRHGAGRWVERDSERIRARFRPARELAAAGSAPGEVARSTGLARDAARLLAEMTAPQPATSSGKGRMFRAAGGVQPRRATSRATSQVMK